MKKILNKIVASMGMAALVAIPALADDPAPAVPVSVVPVIQPVDPHLTLSFESAPAALVEAIRQQIVASGVLALPEGVEGRPIVRLMLNVTDGKARGLIVLGPAPEPTPTPEP